MLQTILGAGGAIGRELARVLPECGDRVRLVSRRPQKARADDELHAASSIAALNSSRPATVDGIRAIVAGDYR